MPTAQFHFVSVLLRSRLKVSEHTFPEKKLYFLQRESEDESESESHEEESDSSSDDSDGNYLPDDLSKHSKRNLKKYNTLDSTPISAVADRYGVSSTIVAAVATATLQSINLVTKDNTEHVIDPNKVERSRAKLRNKLRSASLK